MKKQNCKNKKTNYKKTAGITLIALVVTIIVLLILAGISIMMLTGNNGILTRAGQAKEMTEIAGLEEELQLEYLSLLTGQYAGGENATFANAINSYNTKNPTKPQVTSESASGQIEIDKVELSSTNIRIGVDSEENANVKTVEVIVTPKQNTGMKHYVTISGKKYEVKDENGEIKIDRTPTNTTGTGITIQAEVADSTVATASVNGTTITITGKLVAGSTKLNLTVNGTPYNEIGTIVAKAVLKPGGTAVATETDNYVDSNSNGKTATVPAGFTVSNVKTETEIDKGLVIKKGSDETGWDEYVWIEVPKDGSGPNYATVKGETEGTEGYYTAIENALVAYAGFPIDGTWGGNNNTDQKTKKIGWKDEWYDSNSHTYDGTNWYKYDGTLDSSYSGNVEDTAGCGLTRADYITQYQRMLKSVYTNGGFWIGRYEASSNSTAPLSQKGKKPQSDITCSNAQKQAAKVATSDTTNNENSKNYTSSLMFGIQWDLVCKFLEGSSEWTITESTPASWYIKTDSSSWGVYSKNSKSNTGSSTDPVTKRRNIYDFAGNVYEWTLEHAASKSLFPCSLRGGGFDDTGSYSPASRRNYDVPTSSGGRGRFPCCTLLVDLSTDSDKL